MEPLAAARELEKRFQVAEVDERDAGTPDEWVKREASLVRLTGKLLPSPTPHSLTAVPGRHPFNCEPPLTALLDAGPTTPSALHYVRNHGACPRVDWATHTVTLSGAVPSPRTWGMDELARLPAQTLPVLLVCAGNRRKEENMLKQTIGFSWGPSGLGCSLWTGVPLRELLHLSGVTEPSEDAQHVCFRGPLGELPKGEDGSYATSIPLWMALDPGSDVMVAYEQNGERLQPDHGAPVRLIIPGWIGGRMVKWLCDIRVTAAPSQNFYHFNDNRILPPEVDAERAAAEGWWFRQEYIFNELNINSAMRTPAHGEELLLQRAANTQPYELRGYAYTGGGRQVTRVEVSADDGLTWQLAALTHPFPPTPHGRWWCWALWSLVVDARCLLLSPTLRCRAWDASSNTQPRDITWNVMGMGNNCHFTVRVHQEEAPGGAILLRFEHPTEPGALKGGWMGNTAGGWAPQQSAAGAAPPPSAPAPPPPASPAPPPPAARAPSGVQFTMSEVEKHCTADDCWIVVSGRVYDTTRFNHLHPGGGSSIFINAGTDTTEEFEAIHSRRAWEQLEEWYIGDLAVAPATLPAAAPATPAAAVAPPSARSWGGPPALDARKRHPFVLQQRRVLSQDSLMLRFALQSPAHVLNLPCGQHLYLAANVRGKLVMRAYTPVGHGAGWMDILVKVYRSNAAAGFPDGGVFSQHLEALTVGDSIEAKGPLGHIEYLGGGAFDLGQAAPVRCERVAMVAGGSGITPMFQLLTSSLSDTSDATRWWLLFANRKEEDVLLRCELEALAAAHPHRFTLTLMLSGDALGGWAGLRGRVTEAALRRALPGPEETLAFLCGPDGQQTASAAALRAMGYLEERIHTF